LGLPVKVAWVERLVAAYFSKFAGIAKWRQSSVANTRADKLVRTKIGRIILVPDNATDTSLFCLPVQTTGADAFKLALYFTSSGMEGVDAHIVNTFHDEIIVEAREGIEDQVQSIVEKSMEEEFKQIIPAVPFVAEIRLAHSWE
jgi:DNA polymerase I-like protein with 3'-5' exonuclease and polymerase domains